ncbi:alpha/beta fold hydrolase [Kribbia dieselivorans]|uniref:alpha/beta fold hydrolase n=1 Tax=Kribbia dieselivorans TaxID=331526 RepID=UPI0008388353|nr:alpha/beta hydrolase [Kribbia dieselivorans]
MPEQAIPQHDPTPDTTHTDEPIVLVHGGNSGGWTWEGVTEHLPGRRVLTPDLPGYGERYDQVWPGLAGAADDLADLIGSQGSRGAHVVGLSLGGFVCIHLLHRHPEVVRSCIISGAALAGYSRIERLLIRPQVPLWHRRWYWAAQTPLFRIPADSRERFVTTASRPSLSTNRAMFDELAPGALPAGPFTYSGPVLAVTAEHDTRSVRRSFAPLRERLPQVRTWVAPKVHHAWSAENPELFARMIAAQVDTGQWAESR